MGKKNGGSRTIAILHPTYRLTLRLVSAHISQWDVKFAGSWNSALKGSSALRAHAARAAGIELAHTEGQNVIHFLWDMRKFYDSISAHLLIPQLVARGVTRSRFLLLGMLTDKSPRCLPSRQRIQRHHQWLCNQHSGRLSPELLLDQRPTFLNLSKLWGTWFLDRSAKNTSLICHNLLRIRPAYSCVKTQH